MRRRGRRQRERWLRAERVVRDAGRVRVAELDLHQVLVGAHRVVVVAEAVVRDAGQRPVAAGAVDVGTLVAVLAATWAAAASGASHVYVTAWCAKLVDEYKGVIEELPVPCATVTAFGGPGETRTRTGFPTSS